MVKFMSIGSGSSGNCYYIGTEEEGFFLDSGIPYRMVSSILKKEGVPYDKGHIKGIILTHDHADHVRSVGNMAHQLHLPIYATDKVVSSIQHSRFIREDLTGFTHKINYFEPFEVASFRLTAFPVPHDSSDNVGYLIERGEFVMALVTDIGHVTETILSYIRRANHVVVEANYDKEMLANGSYPDFLKDRVAGPFGHISNDECANLLAFAYHINMKNIWLCHLSRENNHPDLCWKTVESRLFQEGIRVGKDVSLTALKRSTPSPMYTLED